MRRLNNNITMLKILFTLAMTLGWIKSFNFCANKDLEMIKDQGNRQYTQKEIPITFIIIIVIGFYHRDKRNPKDQ